MPIPMMDSVEFNKIPSLQFVVPIVTADPTGYQAGLIFNSTDSALKFHNGTTWVALGQAGAGGPPSGSAGGDLSGSYPNPAIKADVIVDADVNTAAAIAQSKIANLVADLASKATTAQLASYQALAQKGVASGYAPLDAGNLIPTAHLPPLAVNDVFTVANEAAMLALTAQVGDMAIRTDTNRTYVLSASPASTLANWKEIMAAGQVVSVNAKTGVVTITLAELGGASTARQIISGPGLTGGGDLTADRTIAVVGGPTLSVAADQVDVVSAPKWTTPRSITLSGDATSPAVNLDGSANITINTTVNTVNGGAWNPARKNYLDVPAGTSCVIPHGLGTFDVVVEVFSNSAPRDTVLCDVERTDANTVTLKFATAVAANAYRCVVIG